MKKFALRSVEDQPVVPEALQHTAKMSRMGEAVWASHQNVVQVNQNKGESGQYLVYDMLKSHSM